MNRKKRNPLLASDKVKILLIVIIVGLICYGLGYASGASAAINKMIDVGSDILNIELTPRAREVITNNPFIMRFVLENQGNYNGTNPFINHPQGKVKWEECMMLYGNYTECYEGLSIKYKI